MVTYEELHSDIHKVTELSNVLDYLIDNRPLLDTELSCQLFYQYFDEVAEHLEKVDKNLYHPLLGSSASDTTKIAEKYMSGSQEIKRVIHDYMRHWCNKKQSSLKISNYDDFKVETRKIFSLVLMRMQDETEHLYPAVKTVTGDALAA
mgnify:CR=1 FL=1